ncbi:MAG: hypothetical protein NVV73_09235 [Cellvibrionaceae bacterium]|nr:hypothetical protein [Cellvibrionaceae bacterium]
MTNIFIHIFNGAILFFLTRKLVYGHAGVRGAWWCSPEFLVATLWVLHPLHSSSVLYIVQRMTLLSATFSLLTVLAYVEARNALLAYRYRKALVGLLVAFGLSILAVLSKENAVVLPLQILILEMYLRTLNPHSTKLHRSLIWVAVVPAAIIVLAYPVKTFLVHLIDYLQTGQENTYGRNFTMIERFWTEQRVVGDYIVSLVLPSMQSSGVFHDNYPLSRNLFRTDNHVIVVHISCRLNGICFLSEKSVAMGFPWCFLVLWISCYRINFYNA